MARGAGDVLGLCGGRWGGADRGDSLCRGVVCRAQLCGRLTFKKTEVLMSVIVGLVVLGEGVSLLGFLAIVLGLAGVLLLSDPPGATGPMAGADREPGGGVGPALGVFLCRFRRGVPGRVAVAGVGRHLSAGDCHAGFCDGLSGGADGGVAGLARQGADWRGAAGVACGGMGGTDVTGGLGPAGSRPSRSRPSPMLMRWGRWRWSLR